MSAEWGSASWIVKKQRVTGSLGESNEFVDVFAFGLEFLFECGEFILDSKAFFACFFGIGDVNCSNSGLCIGSYLLLFGHRGFKISL